MTNKFLLYDLNAGGFVAENGNVANNDMANAAIFSRESASKATLSLDEESFIQVPLTQGFVDSLPFELADTAPMVEHSQMADNNDALKGDFVVMTDMGFYDEKYNSLINTSRPKVRGYELDYANLYNMDNLKELGNEWITEPGAEATDVIIIPISEVQQEKLQALPAFSAEKEPHGFFMTPIGETQKRENTDMPDLGSALERLETETQGVDLPWQQ